MNQVNVYLKDAFFKNKIKILTFSQDEIRVKQKKPFKHFYYGRCCEEVALLYMFFIFHHGKNYQYTFREI
jgi:hypothetical protein